MNKAQDAKFARLDDPQVSPPILNELTGALSITRVGLTMPCSVHASINSVNHSIQSGDLKAPLLYSKADKIGCSHCSDAMWICPFTCRHHNRSSCSYFRSSFLPFAIKIEIRIVTPTQKFYLRLDAEKTL